MIYTATELERMILGASSTRRTFKKEKYAGGDDGYWTGGFCNWGGTHNLKGDCEKLVRCFNEITKLRQARKELLNFTDEKNFEKIKKELIEKTETMISSLTRQNGANTYIAGVCCIWNDFDKLLNSTIDNFRNAAELLKKDLEETPYNEIKELRRLESERRNLEREIEENECKARNEPDENKRKKFIFLVDEIKEKLKGNLARKKQLKSAGLGDNFNPDQYINDFFTILEDKLTGKSKPSRTASNRPFANYNNSNQANSSSSNSQNNSSPLADHSEEKSFFQYYWKEILLISTYLIGVYYIQSQNYEKAN